MVVVTSVVDVGSFRFSVFFPFFCVVVISFSVLSLPGEAHIRTSTIARP